jgi:hypothetical protein
MEEDKDQQQQKIGPGSTPIYIGGATTIPPLLQLLEQTVEQQYELKALTHTTRSKSSHKTLTSTEQL